MRDQIKKYLATRNDVAFPELMDVIPESSGDWTLFHNNDSLILWEGMSQIFMETIKALEADGSIIFRQVTHETIVLVHAFGEHPTLNYPIAKRVQNYTKPHWIPAVICRGTRFSAKN